MREKRSVRFTLLMLYIGPFMLANWILGRLQPLYATHRNWAFRAQGWATRQILLGALWYAPRAHDRITELLQHVQDIYDVPPQPPKYRKD